MVLEPWWILSGPVSLDGFILRLAALISSVVKP